MKPATSPFISRSHNHPTSATFAAALRVLLLLCMALPASAEITIDTFSDIQPDLMADGIQNDPSILGGQRDVNFDDSLAGTWSVNGSGAAGFVTTLGPGELELNYDGDDASVTANAFALGSVDLTEGGQNDRFSLTIAELGEGTSFTGLIRVFTDTGGASNFYNWAFEVTTQGTMTFLFSLPSSTIGSPDITDVDSIYLWLGTTATALSDDQLDTGEKLSISEFKAIPEPGSAALVILGLLPLAWLAIRPLKRPSCFIPRQQIAAPEVQDRRTSVAIRCWPHA